LPFVLSSIPAAFAGGMLPVPRELFSLLLGVALLLSAGRLLLFRAEHAVLRRIEGRGMWLRALPIGATLGFLAGMIGIGGGVFLSPLLLLLRWADARQTAAISAAFIVLNSMSGMAGQLLQRSFDPLPVLPLAAAVGLGGWLGSRAGAFVLHPKTVRFVLAAVLLLAGGKLIGRLILGAA
ncbi:MAG: sulfite exporter TauE/SafE family protein, partial [Bacteroidota bacterium]|nr:sulfite exporter TauE/SafE family protein [Bacteroidota bacterium]